MPGLRGRPRRTLGAGHQIAELVARRFENAPVARADPTKGWRLRRGARVPKTGAARPKSGQTSSEQCAVRQIETRRPEPWHSGRRTQGWLLRFLGRRESSAVCARRAVARCHGGPASAAIGLHRVRRPGFSRQRAIVIRTAAAGRAFAEGFGLRGGATSFFVAIVVKRVAGAPLFVSRGAPVCALEKGRRKVRRRPSRGCG
jgi:hypothetical protein